VQFTLNLPHRQPIERDLAGRIVGAWTVSGIADDLRYGKRVHELRQRIRVEGCCGKGRAVRRCHGASRALKQSSTSNGHAFRLRAIGRKMLRGAPSARPGDPGENYRFATGFICGVAANRFVDAVPLWLTTRPLPASRTNVPAFCIVEKFSMPASEFASTSKDPPPMRWPFSQSSSMKRRTEVWSVTVIHEVVLGPRRNHQQRQPRAISAATLRIRRAGCNARQRRGSVPAGAGAGNRVGGAGRLVYQRSKLVIVPAVGIVVRNNHRGLLPTRQGLQIVNGVYHEFLFIDGI